VKPVQASVSVDRPIHDVFAFLAEGRNNPTWKSDVSLAARIAGAGTDLGIGTTFMQKATDSHGRTVDETYMSTRYEPPHLLEFTVIRGTTRTTGRYTLARIDPDTTHVEFTLHRVSPEYRAHARRDLRDDLRERVNSIAAVPAAMNDQDAPQQ
jgi:hypothetical protein